MVTKRFDDVAEAARALEAQAKKLRREARAARTKAYADALVAVFPEVKAMGSAEEVLAFVKTLRGDVGQADGGNPSDGFQNAVVRGPAGDADSSDGDSGSFGGEGLFNLKLDGKGAFCIEADCPREELIEINMTDDVLRIDGNFAVAWSAGLSFTVERSGKSLLGSAASGEGLVNVYRGTGRVLMMPVRGSRLSFPTVE